MRIGTHVTTAGIRPIADLRDDAAAAVARGLDSVWASQQVGGWDPLRLLPALGDGPAELGTAIVPTYPQHPVTLATAALTVQSLAGGRLTLGIGPSHEWFVTRNLGLAYASPARHTREYLEVLRPLLRGERVEHTGRFFTVDTGSVATGVPAPPVLVAALGPRMLEVARDLADGTVAVWVRPRTVAEHLVPALHDGARVAALVTVAITADPDGVRERFARDVAMVGELPAYRAVLDRGGLTGPADALVAGSEAVVLAELRRFRDAGLTDLIVTPHGTGPERERVLDALAQLRVP